MQEYMDVHIYEEKGIEKLCLIHIHIHETCEINKSSYQVW